MDLLFQCMVHDIFQGVLIFVNSGNLMRYEIATPSDKAIKNSNSTGFYSVGVCILLKTLPYHCTLRNEIIGVLGHDSAL